MLPRRMRPSSSSPGSHASGLLLMRRRCRVDARPHQRLHPVDRHREDDRRVLLRRDLDERLQVAQVQRDRLRVERRAPPRASCLLASNSPEAWMILARFSRSDSACFAMARCISCGRSTAFTATWVTLTPQGSVCWSMTSCSLSAEPLALGEQLVEVRPGRGCCAASSAPPGSWRRGSSRRRSPTSAGPSPGSRRPRSPSR